MKKLYILLFLAMAALWALPAQADDFSVYRKGKLVQLQPDFSHVFVAMASQPSQDDAQRLLSKGSGLVDAVAKPILHGPSNGVEITLLSSLAKRLTANNYREILAPLLADQGVVSILPRFNPSEGKGFVLATHRLMWHIKKGTGEANLKALLQGQQGRLVERINMGGDQEVLVLEIGRGRDVFALARNAWLAGQSEVSEPDFITQARGDVTPNDPSYPSQQYLSQFSDADIDADLAWTVANFGNGGVVAVIDGNGIDVSHPDLYGKVDSPFDAVNNDNDPSPENSNANHGTPCAGIIAAATNNALGVASVGYNLHVVPICIGYNAGNPNPTSFNTSDAIIARAASRVIAVANVYACSNSWSGPGTTTSQTSSYASMYSNGRGGKGTLVLASTGNDNAVNASAYPCNFPNVIGVGATDPNDIRSSFSNYGTYVDVAAPGNSILTVDRQGTDGYNNTAGTTGDYTYFGGTSAACPVASAIVGLVGAANTTALAADLALYITNSCEKVGGYTYTYEASSGLTRSNELGYGRVNALMALDKARGNGPAAGGVVTGSTYCGNSISGNTTNGVNRAFSYGGGGNILTANELVYSFVPNSTDLISVVLSNTTTNLSVYILGDQRPGSYIAGGGKEAQALVTAGKTYYIVVDGTSNSEGAFSLKLHCLCAPPPSNNGALWGMTGLSFNNVTKITPTNPHQTDGLAINSFNIIAGKSYTGTITASAPIGTAAPGYDRLAINVSGSEGSMAAVGYHHFFGQQLAVNDVAQGASVSPGTTAIPFTMTWPATLSSNESGSYYRWMRFGMSEGYAATACSSGTSYMSESESYLVRIDAPTITVAANSGGYCAATTGFVTATMNIPLPSGATYTLQYSDNGGTNWFTLATSPSLSFSFTAPSFATTVPISLRAIASFPTQSPGATTTINPLPAIPTITSSAALQAACSRDTARVTFAGPGSGNSIQVLNSGAALEAASSVGATSFTYKATQTFHQSYPDSFSAAKSARSVNATTGCRSSLLTFKVKFYAEPVAPVVSGITGCPGQTGLQLSGFTASSSGQYNWYGSANGRGGPLYTGNPFPLPALSADKNYYVDRFHTYPSRKCYTPITGPVLVDIGDTTPPFTYPYSRCGAGTVLVEARIVNQDTPTFRYYLAPTGGTAVASNKTGRYQPVLNATTNYYVDALTDFGCTTRRTPVKIDIFPSPTITTVTPPTGPAGTVVTVNGTNLMGPRNIGPIDVRFDNTPAFYKMPLSATQLIAAPTTPASGTFNFGEVRVTTDVYEGCVAYQSQKFNLIQESPTTNNWRWVRKNIGTSTNASQFNRVRTDNTGNHYAAGSFTGIITLDGPTASPYYANLYSAGGFDGMLARYTRRGQLGWVVRFSGTGDDEALGLATDKFGYAYVSGYFTSSMTIYQANGTAFQTLTSAGGRDMFVAKVHPDGHVIYAFRMGASGDDQANGIDVAPDLRFYVAGSFRGATAIGGSTGTVVPLTSRGNSDAFLAKFSDIGTLYWAIQAGGTGNDYGYGAAADITGGGFLMGSYEATATFNSSLGGTTPISKTVVGGSDGFVLGVSLTGQLNWVASMGGTTNENIRDLAADPRGTGVVAVGGFSNTATFGTLGTLTATGFYDAFAVRLNNAGAFSWVKKTGGFGQDQAYGVRLDRQGNPLIALNFNQTVPLFGSTTISPTSLGSGDALIVKLNDADQSVSYYTQVAGTLGDDNAFGVDTVSEGGFIAGGSLGGDTRFGLLGPFAASPVKYNAWVGRYSTSGSATRELEEERPVIEEALGGNTLRLWPNPAGGQVSLQLAGAAQGENLRIFSAEGRELASHNLTTAELSNGITLPLSLPAGLYLVRCGAHTAKLTVR